VHDHQRPKLDRYRTHLFANMYAVRFDEQSGELSTSEISAFITERALITVRKADFDVDTLLARWDASPEPAASPVGFLVHGLLDAVVDGHYSAVEQLDAAVDELEDALFDPRPGLSIRRRGFELRKSLAQLRRVVVPMRELVGRLLREDTHLVDEALAPYYQDVHDHVLRAAESVETARDLVASILDTELNEQGKPAQRDHQEARGVGGDHRGADRGHRFLRSERALPRLLAALGVRRQHRHCGALRWPVPAAAPR